MDPDVMQSMLEPLSTFLIVMIACASLVLAAPGSALARRHSHKPSAKATLSAAINVHNATGDSLADVNAGNIQVAIGLCDTADTQTGDDRAQTLATLDQTIASYPTTVKRFQDFNKTSVDRWPGYFKPYRKALKKASQRRKFDHAIGKLKDAYTSHSKEFFQLNGVYTDLQAHNCTQAHADFTALSATGAKAWTLEAVGLDELRDLWKPKAAPRYGLFSPYESLQI